VSDEPRSERRSLSPELARALEPVCDRFEDAWQSGVEPRLEDYLAADMPQALRPALLRELILLDIDYRQARGQSCSAAMYRQRFPELSEEWLASALETSLETTAILASISPGELQGPASGHEPGPATTEAPKSENSGSWIGPYKLLQKLGEGGMGTVYVAQQERPVARRVALKIIKAGMDSAQVSARFEQERQALALMDHPNIARVFDAGTTETGRPYFVMELVKGIPFTRFCDQEHLTPKERLELFIPICHAVQHAHQKGIIHRDLKPSNVLIALYDGRPVPKVIDFGVAKATGQKLTEQTMFTEVGQIVGTLEYMAPEQAELNNLDIDTRADIYSLGVLLYELLTGSPPFTGRQLRSAAFTEMLRLIREVEPPKPSTKVSTAENLPSLAALRKLEPKKLALMMRGDLDWIVMKCLEKERSRRYETANELALEIQRYLADEPVLAGPPAAVYKLRKFVKRNAGPVLAASIILVLLVVGIIGTSLGFVRAERLRQVAEREEAEAKEQKARAQASQQQAMEALRATTDEVIQQLIGTKAVLGLVEKGFLENSLKRWQAFAAEQGDDELARQIRAEGVFRVADLRANLGEPDAAVAGYGEAAVLWAKLAADFPTVPQYRHELARSHGNSGLLLVHLGKHAEAEAAYRQALAVQEQLASEFPSLPEYRQNLARSHNNLGLLLHNLGKRAEVEAAYRQALTIQEKLAADFPAVSQYRLELAHSHNNLGLLLRDLGKRAEAEAPCRQALVIKKKLVAEFPAVPLYRKELASSHNNVGLVLLDLGKRAEAEAAYRQALTIRQKLVAEFPAVPEYREDLAGSHNNLGLLLRDLGKRAEAEAAYRQALVIKEKLAAEFPTVPQYRGSLANGYTSLGALLVDLGKRAEAEVAHRQALTIQEKLAAEFPAVPEYRMTLAGSQVNFGILLRANKQPEQALQWYDKAIATLERLLQQVKADATGGIFLRNAHWGRAVALDDLQRHAEAAASWDKAAELALESEHSGLRMSAAASRVRAGQVDAALRETEELAKNADAASLYDAACVFGLAADRRDETAGTLPKEECAKRAIALLRQAVAKGYKDVEHMKMDEDLKALRLRDDFKKLLAELEAGKKIEKK
jgi:serine/threonine protein kinase/Tfp pilus assembly protein PilF